MTEQHEWEWLGKESDGKIWRGDGTTSLAEFMPWDEVVRRLNEYETLKKARDELTKLVATILCWKPEWAQTPYFYDLPDLLKETLIELAKSTAREGGGGGDEWLSKLEGKDG